jgi:two-component system sensor kinase FixL
MTAASLLGPMPPARWFVRLAGPAGLIALCLGVAACAGGFHAEAIGLGLVGAGLGTMWVARTAVGNGARRDRSHAEALFESIVEPLIVIDDRGIVTDANHAVDKVFGWLPEELCGQNVNVLMGEPYRTEHQDYIRAYLDTGRPQAIGRVRKVVGRHRSGRDFPVEISISEIGTGRRRFIGMVRDVSDREEMTAMLNHAERLAAVGELAASVAHEVNNPVNTIINCAQLLRDGDTDPDLLEDIDAEAARIAEIVRELLDLSRDNKESASSLDLQVVVSRTVTLMRRRMMSKGVELSVAIPKGLPMFIGRRQEIQQVLLNLLINAQDAVLLLEEGAERHVEIRGESLRDEEGNAFVRMIVRDNGPGIPEDVQNRIFEPFFTTKRERGGSGLGLPVSRRIVERHGGRITVQSELGRFTEFCVDLPT